VSVKAPGKPANEEARLDALRSYEVLDTPAEPAFDALTTLAAHIANVPIALVSLVDDERQWFKSRYGLEAPETPREVSFCGHVVTNDTALTVPDALEDARFRDNPLVTGEPRVRFYSGVPLRTDEGFVLGTLCAIDHRARELTSQQRAMLDLLARQVVDQLELRRKNLLLDKRLQELDEVKSRVQSILASANYSIIETTPDGTIREFNAAAERMLGYAAAEVIGNISPAVIHDLDEVVARTHALSEELGVSLSPGFETFIAKARRGIPDEREWTYVRKDGSRFPVDLSVTARLGPSGEIVGFMGIASDISARKEAESLLRKSEEALREQQRAVQDSETRLRSIIDTAVDGIITIDTRGCIESANPAVERLFGLKPSDLTGRHVKVLIPTRDHSQTDAFLGSLLARSDERLVGIVREVEGLRKDGSTFPAELVISEFALEGSRHFTGIVRDISDRKRVERLQSEFVSTVSHELRTPLTSIRGSLGLIAGGVLGEIPKDAKEYVDIAVSNSDRLVRLINDILDMEKIQSGSMEFRLHATDLSVAMRSAMDANQAFANAHHTHLTITGSIPPGEVLVDPDRLAQVLTNLISNACKFSPPGAAVELSVARERGQFRVSVRDHGPGIPKEFEGRIFERFAQADASTTRQKGGTGLGLSITRALVEKMRGRVGFQPAEGGGTQFFFDLPYFHPIKTGSASPPSTMHVLVCEDDPDVSRLLEKLLGAAGYSVHVAPTLERARRLLTQNRYHAMTLDLMLADGESSALISELRSTEATRHIPIIIVSGSERQLGPAAVLVTDVIVKPFDEARLVEAVSNAAIGHARERPRLLHVEDDPDLRRIVQKTLPETWEVVSVDTLRAAKQALAEHPFDLVLLDLTLPDGGGDELLEFVGGAQVIIFSAEDASSDLSRRVSAALVKSRSTPGDVRDRIISLISESRAPRNHP